MMNQDAAKGITNSNPLFVFINMSCIGSQFDYQFWGGNLDVWIISEPGLYKILL